MEAELASWDGEVCATIANSYDDNRVWDSGSGPCVDTLTSIKLYVSNDNHGGGIAGAGCLVAGGSTSLTVDTTLYQCIQMLHWVTNQQNICLMQCICIYRNSFYQCEPDEKSEYLTFTHCHLHERIRWAKQQWFARSRRRWFAIVCWRNILFFEESCFCINK